MPNSAVLCIRSTRKSEAPEYLARLLTASHRYPARHAFAASITFAVTPMALIDLAAILPFYLPFFIAADLRFLRILRLTRVLRVLKINRYSRALSIIGTVLRRKASELLVTVFVTLLLLLLSSSIMYYLESDAQPGAFPNIIASLWWAVATLTTVGYGDVFPVTGWGRVVAGVIALLGIGLVALPTGIVSAGFLEEIQNRSRDRKARQRRPGTRTEAKSRRKAYAKRRRTQRLQSHRSE